MAEPDLKTKMEKKISKKREALLANLFSAKADKVRNAIAKIPDEGDPSLIFPMLRSYHGWEQEEDIRTGIAQILMQLKTESAIPVLLRALEEPEFESDRAFIISIFWNAGLFPVEHIDFLVRQAIIGDFMVALEVLTVIENIESGIDQTMAQEAMLDIDEYLEENPEAVQAELLRQIKQFLHTYLNQ